MGLVSLTPSAVRDNSAAKYIGDHCVLDIDQGGSVANFRKDCNRRPPQRLIALIPSHLKLDTLLSKRYRDQEIARLSSIVNRCCVWLL